MTNNYGVLGVSLSMLDKLADLKREIVPCVLPRYVSFFI